MWHQPKQSYKINCPLSFCLSFYYQYYNFQFFYWYTSQSFFYHLYFCFNVQSHCLVFPFTISAFGWGISKPDLLQSEISPLLALPLVFKPCLCKQAELGGWEETSLVSPSGRGNFYCLALLSSAVSICISEAALLAATHTHTQIVRI